LRKGLVLCGLMVFLMVPSLAGTAQLFPCTIIVYANANTYIQSPTFSQWIAFDTQLNFNTNPCKSTTSATIIVGNPPQNPAPTAPVYMALADSATNYCAQQLLLMVGTTTITKSDFPAWFADGWNGVVFFSATPWVPASVTIIYQ